MDEKIASRIIFLEAKGGKKKKDPLLLAKAVDYFVNSQKSYSKANEYLYGRYKFRISERMLRKLASLVKLPEEVQELLSKGKIGIDIAAQLAESKLDDETKIRLGEIVADMNAHDAREVIQYAVKSPNASIEDYKQRVLATKPKTQELFVAVIPLRKETYEKLKKEAEERKVSLHELSKEIIESWLRNKERDA